MTEVASGLAAKMWFAKDATRKTGRLVIFSLLSIWVHCTGFFFLTTALFHGKIGAASDESSAIHEPIVEVRLQAAALTTPPMPPPVDTQTTPPTTVLEQQRNISDHSGSANPQAGEPPKQEAPKDGVLGCESLATKPERLIVGPDYLPLEPDGTPPGHMVLHETIHRDGRVIAVRVEESTMSRKMEDMIVAAAYRKIYRAGEIAGVAVDCDMKYTVSPTPFGQ